MAAGGRCSVSGSTPLWHAFFSGTKKQRCVRLLVMVDEDMSLYSTAVCAKREPGRVRQNS